MRRAKFRTPGQFDGVKEATVIIESDGPHALFRVRPLHRRREYVLPLSDVAEIVVWRIARAEAAERDRQKARRRR